MIIFLDTSAWIKYFLAEAGTTAVQDFLLQQSQNPKSVFTASVITYAEIHATFTRAWKGQRITSNELEQMRNVFEIQWENITLAEVDQNLIARAGLLAKRYAIRGCDAFQLASALIVQAQLFIACDNDLNNAAKGEELQTWNPLDGVFWQSNHNT